MYSEHYGTEYFRYYNCSRDIALSHLSPNLRLKERSFLSIKEQLQSEFYNRSSTSSLPKSFMDIEGGLGVIDTKELCEKLLNQIFYPNERSNELLLYWLAFYVRKIEVGKRIFNLYDSLGKPKKDSGEVGFESYSRLSALLGLFISEVRTKNTKEVKFLNALLKLNDLLAFELKELIQSNQFQENGVKRSLLAAIGIYSEQRLIEQLINSKGIVNDTQ